MRDFVCVVRTSQTFYNLKIMKQNEENSQKAQKLTQEEMENVNGGFVFKKRFGIRRNGKDDWDW